MNLVVHREVQTVVLDILMYWRGKGAVINMIYYNEEL